MKNFFYALLSVSLLGCGSPAKTEKANTELKATWIDASKDLYSLFTLQDAIKILGEETHLSDSATTIANGILRYQCSYLANAKDESSGKTGAIYFLTEKY